MFEELLTESSPSTFAWERKKAIGVSVADLNEELLRGAVRLGVERGRLPETALTIPVEKLLEKLRLISDGKPNNAAVMLFGNNIYEYPQLKVRMACFNGNDKQSFVDNRRAEGNFFELLDAGMAFLFKHLNQSGRIVGLQREEQLEIPYVALREALVNAYCHRQYERFNLTCGIAIYDDRVEIENPGTFPPEITPESIKQEHGSYP